MHQSNIFRYYQSRITLNEAHGSRLPGPPKADVLKVKRTVILYLGL